ncbi:IclR family transcriptional regulator [Pseudomonas fluorescens]|uniref:IclR family transcriptional regulator n=1 Tax=Pseudomonas fluorescens TaxID=294 RepID=UPI001903071B|nr:IclR family transcriptional regulator [Pseudomonas fluorescens]MBD8094592.1 IclR family transcriptional regulator [Pseudomonas fluorescens]MBD8720497.1 IclR family transcriptional regulator [Pseudomonas fluorescens]
MSSSARDRALSIIELLVKNINGLSMTDISEQLAIPRTATHRLLGELKEMGYLKQPNNGNLYVLTIRLASLGLTYLAASGITDATQPLLDELAGETGELVRLAMIEGDSLVYVAKAQGARTGLRYDPDAGADVYLPAAASGHAWLASVGDARALELIGHQGLQRAENMGPNAPRSLRELMDQIERTRERGYGVVHDSYEAGTSALACLILNHSNQQPVAALSIAGPSVRLNDEKIAGIVPLLIDYAGRLGALSLVSRLSSER